VFAASKGKGDFSLAIGKLWSISECTAVPENMEHHVLIFSG
jgi:hypothetical protein